MTTFQPKPPRILREVHVSTLPQMWKVNKVRCKYTYQSHSVDCKQTTAFNNPIHSGTSSLSGPVTSVANTVTGIMVVYTRPIQSFQMHLPSLWSHTPLWQTTNLVRGNLHKTWNLSKNFTLKLRNLRLMILVLFLLKWKCKYKISIVLEKSVYKPNKQISKFHISTQSLQRNAMFSGKI